MRIPHTIIGLLLLWTMGSMMPLTAAQSITLVEAGRSLCAVVYPADCALSERTARKLGNYLREQTGAEVMLLSEVPTKKEFPVLIVLDGTPAHDLARAVASKGAKPLPTVSGERAESYRLATLRKSGSQSLILALGKSPAGAKYSAYRLMRELEIANGSARLRALDVSAEPFIKTRSVSLFNVWGMPIELTRRHNTESWSTERLEDYVDMFDAFGFNAIESHDRFNDNYLQPLFGLRRADWRDKVLRMADVAHTNGQQFFLRIWGHTVMQTPPLRRELGPNESVPKKLKHFCPNDPSERQAWDREIRDYYVNHYAGQIDNLIGHWCDPGICRRNGCDWETPLRLQMDLHNAFKARDPKFQSTFSLWFFDVTSGNAAAWAAGGWPGYTDDRQLINSGILSKDVMIATATAGIPVQSEKTGAALGLFKEEIVQAILKAGHKPALWTWYRADHEIRPSLHIHLHHGLGDYFPKLPPSARQLEWHNVERNVHAAANTASYYVAGRLMWEPLLDPDQLLREFLNLVFGRANASRIMPAYAAIEKIRCNSCDKNWESRRFTGAGTDRPDGDAAMAKAALDELARVHIDQNFRPRIPLDVSPAQIVTDLRESLEVIRDFALCRAMDLPALEKAIISNDHEAAASMVKKLRERYSPWSLSLAGRQEWSVLQAALNRAERK